MEEILSIKEISEGGFSGYEIKTDKQRVLFLISDYQSCCENWGYMISHDEVSDFIGSDLISIELVDDELKSKPVDYDLPSYECYTIFVNVLTSNGLFQLCAYNSHNGYYGHSVKVISNQLTHEDCL